VKDVENSTGNYRNSWGAFILTPIILSLLYLLQNELFHWFAVGTSEHELLQSFIKTCSRMLFNFPFVAIGIELIMMVFALPIFLILRKLNIENLFLTIGISAGIAAFFYALPDLLPPGRSDTSIYAERCQMIIHNVRTACGWKIFWRDIWVNAIYGAVGGLIFWRIYVGKWVWTLR
jgi:hypothetical protein